MWLSLTYLTLPFLALLFVRQARTIFDTICVPDCLPACLSACLSHSPVFSHPPPLSLSHRDLNLMPPPSTSGPNSEHGVRASDHEGWPDACFQPGLDVVGQRARADEQAPGISAVDSNIMRQRCIRSLLICVSAFSFCTVSRLLIIHPFLTPPRILMLEVDACILIRQTQTQKQRGGETERQTRDRDRDRNKETAT